jgi:hypothetical protein
MITIVSGLPRSGTSMMMQILGAAGIELATDGLRAADADNPNGYFELDAVKWMREDVSFLDGVVGRAVKIVAPLLPFLPESHDYRIVFMERDLGEVLASQQTMLKRRGEAHEIANDAAIERAFRGQLRKVQIWLAAQANVRTLFVSHRGLMEKPIESLRAVADFLDSNGGLPGLGSDRSVIDSKAEAMRRVIDTSLCGHLSKKDAMKG